MKFLLGESHGALRLRLTRPILVSAGLVVVRLELLLVATVEDFAVFSVTGVVLTMFFDQCLVLSLLDSPMLL